MEEEEEEQQQPPPGPGHGQDPGPTTRLGSIQEYTTVEGIQLHKPALPFSEIVADLWPKHEEKDDYVKSPLGTSYIPTEDERRVFRECNQESFYYRSLPFSGMSMLVTQVLISRGILSTSTRFGSIPKVAFAGFCGYLIGKISYMRTCQEKFMRLENSPLGDALRQGHRRFPHPHSYQKSEFSDSTVEHLQPEVNSPSTYSDDYSSSVSDSNYEPVPFSSTLSESAPTGVVDTTEAPSPEIEESKPQRKSMTYDELRNKNRELYEVTVAQKADSLHKPTPQRLPDNKGVAKTNKYGDTWEE